MSQQFTLRPVNNLCNGEEGAKSTNTVVRIYFKVFHRVNLVNSGLCATIEILTETGDIFALGKRNSRDPDIAA